VGIFGALDVPIVYMSNRLWRTQHPAPVFGGASGAGMAWSMTRVLLWNILAWFAWGVMILIVRYSVERHRQGVATRAAELALYATGLPEEETSRSKEVIMSRMIIPLALIAAAALFGGAFFWATHPPAYAVSLAQVVDHHFVVAAYAVTWTIQLSYLSWLGLKWARQVRAAERLDHASRSAVSEPSF
jgi:hypothetical protein